MIDPKMPLHVSKYFDEALSAFLLRAQPQGSRLLVYGGLSLQGSQADPASLIFEGKRLERFWLDTWPRSKTLLG